RCEGQGEVDAAAGKLIFGLSRRNVDPLLFGGCGAVAGTDISQEAVQVTVYFQKAEQRLRPAGPMPGAVAGEIIRKGPNAEIGIVGDQRIGREVTQLAERGPEKK